MIVFWSTPEIDDLKAIQVYITQGSEHYAAEFIQRILQSVQKLERFPELGRMVPEIQDPIARELVFQNYRILYRVKLDRIDIVAVIHGRRDTQKKKMQNWEIL